MHTPAPALPLPFTRAERAAALWAVACAHLLLERGEQDRDPAAADLRGMVPGLLPATVALKAGTLDAEDAHAVAVALDGICQARDLMPAEVWAALKPPPAPVLESARAKAARLGGVRVGVQA